MLWACNTGSQLCEQKSSICYLLNNLKIVDINASSRMLELAIIMLILRCITTHGYNVILVLMSKWDFPRGCSGEKIRGNFVFTSAPHCSSSLSHLISFSSPLHLVHTSFHDSTSLFRIITLSYCSSSTLLHLTFAPTHLSKTHLTNSPLRHSN